MHETSRSRIPRAPVDAADRAHARRLLRERRHALGAQARESAARAILAALKPVIESLSPPVLAAYWPMREEPDLRPAFARWHASGLVVALPCVVGPDVALSFRRWRPGVQMVRGPHGTHHPLPNEPVVPDLLILPCLGFDAGCFRLGYGGGFYDRTLAGLAQARSVGVAYDDCEMTGFRPEDHDRALDWVVTERRRVPRAPPCR